MKNIMPPREGFTALHRGFRHKVWYGFRDGASTARLRRKYSLTQSWVAEIIREHMRFKRPSSAARLRKPNKSTEALSPGLLERVVRGEYEILDTNKNDSRKPSSRAPDGHGEDEMHRGVPQAGCRRALTRRMARRCKLSPPETSQSKSVSICFGRPSRKRAKILRRPRPLHIL